MPFLSGTTASQEPWFQYPGGKGQLLFEYNKLQDTVKGEIIEIPIDYY